MGKETTTILEHAHAVHQLTCWLVDALICNLMLYSPCNVQLLVSAERQWHRPGACKSAMQNSTASVIPSIRGGNKPDAKCGSGCDLR